MDADLSHTAPKPCVGSGMCCKKSACAFGEWDAQREQCAHLQEGLVGASITIYRCGIHAFISQQPEAHWNPAFGSGCCMPLFNDARGRIIRVLRDETDPDHPAAIKLLTDGQMVKSIFEKG